MNTVLAILKQAGGWRPSLYVKIENPPYMELVIEALGEPGPSGLRALSVCHYGEQNGDLMRDPEMCFELFTNEGEATLDPWYSRNDYVGVEQWSRNRIEGSYVQHRELHKEHVAFARLWDMNLHHQGFKEVFTVQHVLG